MDLQTFRQQCAIAAMREIISAATRKAQNCTEEELCRETAEAAFAFADAMVAAAKDRELPSHGAAPSRTGVSQ